MLPPIPFVKFYRGSKPEKQRENARAVERAYRIADHLFTLMANDPRDVQVHLFAEIARDLNVTTEQVRDAVSTGGYNGITVNLDEADRRQLERYRKD